MTTDLKKARKIKSQLIETFDAIAPHFDITRYKPWPESKRFISNLPKDSIVLDLGCGNGRNSIHLAKEGMKVIGIDFSRGLIKIAKNKLEWKEVANRVNLIEGDIGSLPLKKESVNAVLYIATIHHLPTPQERLKSLLEVKRCLKPEGSCLVSAWAQEQEKFKEDLEKSMDNSEEGFEHGDIFLPWKLKEGRELQRYYHLFSKEEFEDLIEKSGLDVKRVFFSADNHYAELNKK
ncbi:MAG: class I SAM-dependent methyltransferase [Methanomassiliicoccales archaeon]|nr:MAG: class I SAM-dependent methyltransferase [Methanomassiliicoccales archaeon]